MNSKKTVEEIFLAGVERVLPDRLIDKSVSVQDNHLLISNFTFKLDAIDHVYVIGAGKASALMGSEIERILGDLITGGHIVVKYGHSTALNKIRVTEAGHPVPDANGFLATRSILEIARRAGEKDLVICLLSGGGSALLADFPPGSSPEEMMNVNDILVKSGATINEINAVRKHLSEIKGGQLSKTVYPGTIVTLILSDVIGDPLDVIASGPTVADPSTFDDALDVIRKYDLTTVVPSGIIKYLKEGKAGKWPETPKQGDPVFARAVNILVGNNKLALEAARRRAIGYDLNAQIITDNINGDVSAVSEDIVDTAVKFQNDRGVQKPFCLLFGGEPTVKVTGKGSGGRNQHLALLCALLLRNHSGITILSAGTDGNDGPTPAAGAVVDCDTYNEAVSRGILPDAYLREFDSFGFFKIAGGHIITGPTMTNVMDIIVVIVE